MADLTAQREAIAQTRARIDARLEELGDHVPDAQEMRATALKYAGAAVGVAVGVTAIVLFTKARLHDRRTAADARRFTKTLLNGLPQVAGAYLEKTVTTPPPGPTRKDLRRHAKAESISSAMAQATAMRLAAIERGEVPNPPRGGVGTAVLTGAGVIGGVAIAQALGARRGS